VTRPLILVVNPHSAKGATGRNWPKLRKTLQRILPPFDVFITQRAGDATAFAADAAIRYETIVAVGGDGTINEIANGDGPWDSASRHGQRLRANPRHSAPVSRRRAAAHAGQPAED
jgi:hypothetical protein